VHKNQFLVENLCTAQRYDNLPNVIGKQIIRTFSILHTVTLTQPWQRTDLLPWFWLKIYAQHRDMITFLM